MLGGTQTPILFSRGIFSQWEHLQMLLQVNYEALTSISLR